MVHVTMTLGVSSITNKPWKIFKMVWKCNFQLRLSSRFSISISYPIPIPSYDNIDTVQYGTSHKGGMADHDCHSEGVYISNYQQLESLWDEPPLVSCFFSYFLTLFQFFTKLLAISFKVTNSMFVDYHCTMPRSGS